MGINANVLRFLLYAKSCGVDFTRTATISRHAFHLPFDRFYHVIRNEFNYDVDHKVLESIYNEKYCDKFLEFLGARVVDSFDYSDYEGAKYIHDFNEKISERFCNQYTVVLEAGSLEHIFNFPVAIKNCMQMTQVGGHYLGISPTNNGMGSGFYQFSPELFFRVLNRKNGYGIERMFLSEGRDSKKWYQVPDPEVVKCRVGFHNSVPTLIFILAKKDSDGPIFTASPLQSDYVNTWQGTNPKLAAGKKHNLMLKHLFPQSIKRPLKTLFERKQIPRLFTPFDIAKDGKQCPNTKNSK